jgi:hypothetical protein
MPIPTGITGPIKPRTNGTANPSGSLGNLPGITFPNSLPATLGTGSGTENELFTKIPFSSNNSGITSDYAGQIFLNSYMLRPYLALVSGFFPDYYIDEHKNVTSTFNKETNSKSFSGIFGGTRDKYEIITLDYTDTIVLTSLAGATASVASNITFNHQVVSGGTTVIAKEILWRKLGRVAQ